MSTKIATTLNIDKAVKKDFKTECAINEIDMSEMTEIMWKDYIKVSQELREDRSNKD